MCWTDVSSMHIYRKHSSVPFRDVRSSFAEAGTKLVCASATLLAESDGDCTTLTPTTPANTALLNFTQISYIIITNNMVKWLTSEQPSADSAGLTWL